MAQNLLNRFMGSLFRAPVVFAIGVLFAAPASAQLAGIPPSLMPPLLPMSPHSTARLTVRPHTMATAKQTSRAGVISLDSLDGYYVYVPKHCVGKQRVPLVVFLHGGGGESQEVIEKERQFADEYDMIMLVPNAVTPGRWDVIAGYMNGQTKFTQSDDGMTVLRFPDPDVRRIDAALKQVIRRFAIDPDKIALMGFSDGGSYSRFVGLNNLDIFSRVAPLSALLAYLPDSTAPKNRDTRFYISAGIGENRMVPRTLGFARRLRQDGHAVETVIGLRPHVEYTEDDAFVWKWLAQSWGWKPPITTEQHTSNPASDSNPLLTQDILSKMTAFWSHWMQEPDSIQNTARMANQERITMSIGEDQPIAVIKADMATLAKKYPSIAADLQVAGLTVEQEEAYRAAIIRVGIARLSEDQRGAIADSSILGKNLSFRETHDDEFGALARTKMWMTQ